ncbi:MAG TPA: peptide ABC transporter substrate-binding protein [Phycisphaerales bacterium]|nr:peptide ABC transporter substrate-binding protein [Phycisphaerales bacterium]
MKRAVFIFIFLACVITAAGAMFTGGTNDEADIVFVNRGEVFTLDPQRMSYQQDLRLAYSLYEGLLRWDEHDFSIVPAAAELPSVSDDRLTYTFHIRRNARWSNGDAVTAQDFAYSFRRLLFPDTAADYSNLLFEVAGAKDFFAFRSRQLEDFSKRSVTLNEPERSALAEQLYEDAMKQFDDTVGVKAIDDETLVVHLAHPVAYFVEIVCFAPTYPVYRPCVEGWPDLQGGHGENGNGWAHRTMPSLDECSRISLDADTGRIHQEHGWARPGSIVTNGPYQLTRWRYKRDLKLERNPYFRDQQLLQNNSVLVLTIEDANTALLAYGAGGIDWLNDLSVDYLPELLVEREQYLHRYESELTALLVKGLTSDEAMAELPAAERGESRDVHSLPAFATDFFSFNCREKLADGRDNPFADARVRRAFVLATDREAIVNNITREHEPVMTALVPPGTIAGYPHVEGLGHDIERARRELKSAGWEDRGGDGIPESATGEKFPAIDLVYTTNSSRYKWMALELKVQWEAALGVRVEPRPMQTKFFKDDLRNGKFMIARGQWYGDYSDPTTFLNINTTGDGNNDRGFSDVGYDTMLRQADEEADGAERMRMLADAEAYLFTQNPPMIPICQLQQTYMYDPVHLRGLTTHPRLVQYLWKLRKVS